jgi:hypothetical protein
MPAPSLRLPVTPGNRNRLRALRQAELQAWNSTTPDGANAALRAAVTRAAREGRREFRWLAGMILVAAVAVAFGILVSFTFVQDNADFVALVRRLLGVG